MFTIDKCFRSRNISFYYGKLAQQYYMYKNHFLNFDANIDEVFPRVFVSDLQTSLSEEVLDEIGITHIITAIIGISPASPKKYNYKIVELLDNYNEKIIDQFDETNEFIGKALENKNNKVLIHCMVGASRSATIAAAYIMSVTGASDDEVIKYMKMKRDAINPNSNFLSYLNEFHNILIGKKK